MKSSVYCTSLVLALVVVLAGNFAFAADAPEIDRTGMTVSVSSLLSGWPSNVLKTDGFWGTAGTWPGPPPNPDYPDVPYAKGVWIRIDMQQSYELSKIGHQPWEHHQILGVDIHVTDNFGPAAPELYQSEVLTAEQAEGYWGAPVATATFPQQNVRTDVSFTPTAGRYLILRIVNNVDHWEGVGIQELWLYGNVAVVEPSTYEFAIGEATPSPVVVSTDITLPVTLATLTTGDAGYDAVLFSFEAEGPGSVTFATGEFTATDSGVYGLPDGFPVAAEYDETINWTLRFSAPGAYTITFSAYEVGDEANPFAVGQKTVNVGEWPLAGDLNRDCIIDLLDLIIIRNRLGTECEE